MDTSTVDAKTVTLKAASDLPPELRDRFDKVSARVDNIDIDLPPDLLRTAASVLVISEFALNTLERRPEQLLARLRDEQALKIESVTQGLELAGATEADAIGALRRRRQIEMARIAWRDLAGWTSLEQSLSDLSTLADAMVGLALAHAEELLAPRYGRPVDKDGNDASLLILGMGKLGGHELNFSSDIDLVFLYPDGLQLDGADAAGVEEYFLRLAQTFIRLLDKKTVDGFVFRVDTRLRPFGGSGPLAMSLSAFEAYLLKHGRDWERYAYIKARLLTGHQYGREIFDQLLTPFVYRRYIDYGVFDALRQMKRLIEAEVERKDMQSNIKLGSGGIREVEFIAQVSQLVRGGQDVRLQSQQLMTVLERLEEAGIMTAESVQFLTDAYRYLRTVENRLQAMDDQQTHELPKDPERRARLAYAMGLASWDALDSAVAGHRDKVARQFARIAWDTGAGDEDEGSELIAAWEAGDIDHLLAACDLEQDASVSEQLSAFRGSGLYQRMDEPSRVRLAAVIARLLPMLAMQSNPGAVLSRVLPLVHAICRRSAYLALLNENPNALERVLDLGGKSPMLARQMAEHPALLDELLDARLFDSPPTREELEHALELSVATVDIENAEDYVDALRQFQRSAVFRIAIADRLGGLPLMKVSDRLTDTAELVLGAALEVAWHEMETKYGKPMHGEPGELTPSEFAVIAYGKLGGLELGYGSDLDLVFLHDSSGSIQETAGPSILDNQRFFGRLAQRLIHILTIQTSSGRLYEIDTRLRPNGASGLMVASLASFQKYQRAEAWTWEHQALLRSRSIAGHSGLCKIFEQERVEILVKHVNRDGLMAEIAKMRQRMRRELSKGTATLFDIKQDTGGLADIEFLVDYWVLANAPDFPELVRYPDNVRQLEALQAAELVSADTCERLTASYLEYREKIHALSLNDAERLIPKIEVDEQRAWIASVWEQVFGSSADA